MTTEQLDQAELLERATSTAERYCDALTRISAILGDETAPEKARIMRARLVLAGLDTPA